MELLMGFPPFPAPVSLVTAIPCPPVALFGAHCAMSLEAQMPPFGLAFCFFGSLYISRTHHQSCPFFLAASASFWHLLFVGVWLYLQ